MKKLNNEGLAAIFIVLLTLTVVGIGFTGYRVYQNSKDKPETETTKQTTQTEPPKEESKQELDETANWVVFKSSKGWNMSIPDGWELITGTAEADLVAFGDLIYKQGTPATIEKNEGGRGGPFVLRSHTYAEADPGSQNPRYYADDGIFKAKNVEGKRYKVTLDEDTPMEGSSGDTLYRYVFTKNTITIVFDHWAEKGKTSILPELEKALSTLEIE